MITQEGQIEIEPSYPFSYPKEEIVYFDIETTGLSADSSSLYLIGCIFYDPMVSSWKVIQWFCNDYTSEPLLLDAFFSFLRRYKLLLHFNGMKFDIPYILKKCDQFSLPYDFTHMVQIDLYKQIAPYKKYLNLPDLKQRSLESFLGIKRLDPFTGKELIQTYSNYIHQKYLTHQHSEHLFDQLCLHNKEDLFGLLHLTLFLRYIEYFNQLPEKMIQNQKENILTFRIPLNFFNHKIIYKQEDTITIEWREEDIYITIPLYRGNLKFYYANYKDYYYLPKEDQAIHKSVAQFVEKQYRQKAKASNCFIKKDSTFLPIFDLDQTYPLFYKEYKDKMAYIEWNETVQKDESFLQKYVLSVLNHLK